MIRQSSARFILKNSLVLFSILVAFSLAEAATFVAVSYDDFAKGFQETLQEIREVRDTKDQPWSSARRTAFAWFYAGPCRGDTRRVAEPVMLQLSNLPPALAGAAEAKLIISALYMADEPLGRGPHRLACRYAEEHANDK